MGLKEKRQLLKKCVVAVQREQKRHGILHRIHLGGDVRLFFSEIARHDDDQLFRIEMLSHRRVDVFHR